MLLTEMQNFLFKERAVFSAKAGRQCHSAAPLSTCTIKFEVYIYSALLLNLFIRMIGIKECNKPRFKYYTKHLYFQCYCADLDLICVFEKKTKGFFCDRKLIYMHIELHYCL